ncbi:MAG TPA: Glu-tRNA(Gln) amidotransferase GatDE subunit D, partial [Desulfurococcaceae archaeon]|nr:Glu-tRNA(Gln) amidotransferase GatDE subunit D [Desulfurococcaceae archaeon]
MDSDSLPGYTGTTRSLLKEQGIRVGDRIRVRKGDLVYEGVLMPREKLYDRPIVVLKLDNGYNIGIRITEDVVIEKIGKLGIEYKPPSGEVVEKKGLPRINIVSTGGTIASRVDYETGAVKPALTSQDLAALVPEIFEVANIDTRVLFNIFSEDMEPRHWEIIVDNVKKLIEKGYDGVILTHGTDT